MIGLLFRRDDGAGPSVDRYPGAQVKRFFSQDDAEQWYRSQVPSESDPSATQLPLPKITYSAPAPTNPNIIAAYSDGACRRNGKSNAAAGVGVWWGPGDPRFEVSPLDGLSLPHRSSLYRNLSEKCPGGQSNNRAELMVSRFLELWVGVFMQYHRL